MTDTIVGQRVDRDGENNTTQFHHTHSAVTDDDHDGDNNTTQFHDTHSAVTDDDRDGENNTTQFHDTHSAVTDDDVRTASESNTDEKLRKLQSSVRQLLSVASTKTYTITSIPVLEEAFTTLHHIVHSFKRNAQPTRPASFPWHARRRAAKRHTNMTNLQSRLKAVRRRRRLKRILAKQRRAVSE